MLVSVVAFLTTLLLPGAVSGRTLTTPDLVKTADEGGVPGPLKAHVSYSASLFTPRLLVTPRDGTWRGKQWVNNGYPGAEIEWRWHRYSGEQRASASIILLAAPRLHQSVAATIKRLRHGPHNAYEGSLRDLVVKPVTIAGFRGQELDGTISGKGSHAFVAFGTQPSEGADYVFYKNSAFRIIALDVRGETVVFYLDPWGPTYPASTLAAIDSGLKSLKFPG
jgi:hypothetical protein